MSDIRLHLYEPRWHGLARYSLDRMIPISPGLAQLEVLEKGWMRRPRGAQYECWDITRRLPA